VSGKQDEKVESGDHCVVFVGDRREPLDLAVDSSSRDLVSLCGWRMIVTNTIIYRTDVPLEVL
jgi:hypothetical protein